MAKSCPEKGKQEGKEKEESKGKIQVKGKVKIGKAREWSQKGKEKVKGLQSMNKWDEWDQNDEVHQCATPIAELWRQQQETEAPDLEIASESGKFV